MVDLGAFILLASVFGFPIAIVYVVVGLVLAILGGTIIEKTGVGKHVRDFILGGDIAEVVMRVKRLRMKKIIICF